MTFTKKENDLLQKATISLPQKFRKLLIECLEDLAAKSNWFHEKLFYLLDKGLIFKKKSLTRKDSIVFANYDTSENSISFNTTEFNSDVPIKILAGAIKSTLRHEFTHALDFSLKDKDVMAWATLLRVANHTANLLHNKLACISNFGNINLSALNSITPFLRNDYNTNGSIIVSSSSLVDEWAPFVITKLGSVLVLSDYQNGTHLDFYLLENYRPKFEHIARITVSTMDPTLAYERFQQRKTVRQSEPDAGALEEYFNKYLDEAKLRFWNSLTQQQRSTLDTLYTIRSRILTNVANDVVCHPEFRECIVNEKENCVTDFISCQSNNHNFDAMLRSLYEIRACMQERAEGEQIETSLLEKLCHLPQAKPLIPTVDKIILAPIAMAVLSNSSTLSIAHSLCYSGSIGVSLGFLNGLSEAYTNKQHYYKNTLSLLPNITYLFSIGCLQYLATTDEDASISTQIVLPVVFAMVKQGIETVAKNLKLDRVSNVIKHVGNAVVGVVAGSDYTPLAVISNIIGNVSGRFLANSMAKSFGWHTTEEMSYLLKKYNLPDSSQTSLEKGLRNAATNQQINDLKLFIKFVKNINAQDPTVRRTALHWAAIKGNKACYDLLIKADAKFNVRDAKNNTALDYLNVAMRSIENNAFSIPINAYT